MNFCCLFVKVTRADYLNGRTALHFAAVHGHVRCVRLVVSDFVPSAPFEATGGQVKGELSDCSIAKKKYSHRYCVVFFLLL